MRFTLTAGIILLLLAVGLWGMMHGGATEPRTLEEHVKEHGIFIAESDFSVVEQSTSTVAGVEVSQYRAVDEGGIVTVKVLSSVDRPFAQTYTFDQRQRIRDPFTDTVPPYDGIVGRDIDCPARFLPNITNQQRHGTNYTRYSLYADRELRSGVCSETRSKYRREGILFFCPEQDTLAHLEMFRPLNRPGNESPLSTARCRP